MASTWDVWVSQGGISLAASLLNKYPELRGPKLIYVILGVLVTQVAVDRVCDAIRAYMGRQQQALLESGRARIDAPPDRPDIAQALLARECLRCVPHWGWYMEMEGMLAGIGSILASFSAGLISEWLMGLVGVADVDTSFYVTAVFW